MNGTLKTSFAPMLYIGAGITDIEFYNKAFGATEVRRFTNDDGSIHVAELMIDGALFHLHEENVAAGNFSPGQCKGVTTMIGLMVDDVAVTMERAIAAGAKEVKAVEDYDYGYRQGEIKDPFGHHWQIQKVI